MTSPLQQYIRLLEEALHKHRSVPCPDSCVERMLADRADLAACQHLAYYADELSTHSNEAVRITQAAREFLGLQETLRGQLSACSDAVQGPNAQN